MKDEIADNIHVPNSLAVTYILLVIIFLFVTFGSLGIILFKALKSDYAFWVFIFDNIIFVSGLLIVILFCIFFFMRSFRIIRNSYVLHRTSISKDGICVNIKNETNYSWGDVKSIYGHKDLGRAMYFTILFSDKKCIEIPVNRSNKKQTIDLLNKIYHNVPNETKTNKLAKEFLRL